MGEVLAPLALLAAVIYAFVNFAKLVANADWNGVKTQGIVWIGSIGGVLLVAEATVFGDKIDVYGIALSELGWANKIVIGLVPAAIGIVGYDVKKTFDRSDSSRTLPLFDRLPTGGKRNLEGLAVYEPSVTEPRISGPDAPVVDDGHDAEDPRIQ